MDTRIRAILAALLTATGGFAVGADNLPVSIKVKDDGQSCMVGTHNSSCAKIPAFLAQKLALKLSAAVSVSPTGCGEAALERARVVADTIKKAGFTNVAVAGFLSEPNTKCAP